MRFSRLSLLWKILIPTSLVMTVVFAVTGWLVQRSVVSTTYASVEQEAKASFQAYESLWKARADRLAIREPDPEHHVRRAQRIRYRGSGHHSRHRRRTVVEGGHRRRVLPGLRRAGHGDREPGRAGYLRSERRSADGARGPRAVSRNRPPDSSSKADQLFQVVITPVYVQSAGGSALLDVLVAGYKVDDEVAAGLKRSTGGSEYVFASRGFA